MNFENFKDVNLRTFGAILYKFGISHNEDS